MTRRSSALLPVVTLILAILCIGFGNSLNRPSTAKLPPFSYLPTPEASRLVFPGQACFGSSIVWVTTVLHFADCLLEGADPRFLADLIEITTELDPQWAYPCEFAGMVVTDAKGKPNDRTVRILSKAISRFPDNWLLRIYLVSALRDGAFGLTESVIADSSAKVLLPISAGRMRAPDYVRTLAFTLLQKSGRPDEAMRQLLAMYRSVDDPLLQVRYQEKMAKFLHGALPRIGSDSIEFPKLAGAMLKSQDPEQIRLAGDVLVTLAADSANVRAIGVAKALVGQYRQYQAQMGR
jgi:hypothetical protein